MRRVTYLALGDSYTIGEQVLVTESFPYQAIQMLRHDTSFGGNNEFVAPEIIAKTGWTTDELLLAISQYSFLEKYDFVSLLIGVNNQYRGRSAESFTSEFSELLDFAIRKAGNDPRKVFVLSIPDWGVTPFAEGRDRTEIARQIDDYNAVCSSIATELGCHYLNITEQQRRNRDKVEYLTADKLHPSAVEYKAWATMLVDELRGGLESAAG